MIRDCIKEEVRNILIDIARDKTVISYKGLSERIQGDQVPWRSKRMGILLGDICKEDRSSEVFLPALVVNAKTRKPGPGFFFILKELGYRFSHNEEKVLWKRLRDDVYNAYV